MGLTLEGVSLMNLLALNGPELDHFVSTASGQGIAQSIEAEAGASVRMSNLLNLGHCGQCANLLFSVEVVDELWPQVILHLLCGLELGLALVELLPLEMGASKTSLVHVVGLVHDLYHLVLFFQDAHSEYLALLGQLFIPLFHLN
jgi:hypothetical protein